MPRLLTTRTLLPTAAVAMFAVSDATAQSLTPLFEPNKPLEIMNEDNDPDKITEISVFPGRAGYQGVGGDPDTNWPSPNPATDAPVSGVFGDGTVVDYRFFANVLDENVSLEAVTYASGAANRIGTFIGTHPDNVAGGNINFLDIYETTDPGVGFGGGTQIVPANPADHTTNTMARIADGTGTIDISGMSDGLIYFLAGGAGTERFTLTMSGPGQTDIEVVGDGSWPRDNRIHLHDWSFDNTGLLYDTITYHYYHGDRDGSYARFGGVILDGTVVSVPVIGDFDGDGDVDGVDIAEMFTNFNGPGGGVPANPDTDLDNDGDVDGVDIATLFGAFTGPLSPATVPEPASLALLGLGGLLITRRR